jgi:hypothetical protein
MLKVLLMMMISMISMMLKMMMPECQVIAAAVEEARPHAMEAVSKGRSARRTRRATVGSVHKVHTR